MVATKIRPKITAQVPMTSICKAEISPPFQTPRFPIPIHQSTAYKLASLLQEVASIMDTITGEKMMCGEELDGIEGDVLGGLTEMVLIMEEEVEGMIALADAVEEYVEELELAESQLDVRVADLTPSKGNIVTNKTECPWDSCGNRLKEWGENLGNMRLEDGKGSVRIGLDDKVKGRIELGGLLEEVGEEVLGWRVRTMSVNSDNYGSDRLEVVIEAGISVPITNYKREKVIKQTVISLPPRDSHADTKFRDSGLGLVSPAGAVRRPIKKEPKALVKSSPMGSRTGLGSIRKKKTYRKPQWV